MTHPKLMEWIRLLHDPNDVIEVRSPKPKPAYSGYFRADSDALIGHLNAHPDRTYYQTMNVINPGVYSRVNREMLARTDTTTSDGDIKRRHWLLVDCDPARPSGISSTDEEKEKAHETARTIFREMRRQEWPEPVIADSGNGYHLLYRIDLPKDDNDLVKRVLQAMDYMFSNDEVSVDVANSNPARITKLYGTMATKGANTPERPWRMSGIVHVPNEIEVTPQQKLEQFASILPKEQKQQRINYGERTTFDVEDFLARHHIDVWRRTDSYGATKWILNECPFDSSHKHPDAAIFQGSDGAIGFHCFHNSCAGYTWRDVRLKFEPDAYEPKEDWKPAAPMASGIDYTKIHDSSAAEPVQAEPNTEYPPMILIRDVSKSKGKKIRVRSGINSIDNEIGGFNLGEVTVWSGGNAAGISTIVSQVALAAVDQGYKAVIYSGELRPEIVRDWMYMQAAGPANVHDEQLFEYGDKVISVLNDGIASVLDGLIGDYVSIYNNINGLSIDSILMRVSEHVRQTGARVVILDNLMSMDLEYSNDSMKYNAQSDAVKKIHTMAQALDIHIHFICHPHKTDALLRKESISGTADITNVADNVIMVHGIGYDFVKRLNEMFKGKVLGELDENSTGTVVEIMKNRDIGVQDKFIRLYFNEKVRTVSDSISGVPRFGWSGQIDGFRPVPVPEDIFSPGGCF